MTDIELQKSYKRISKLNKEFLSRSGERLLNTVAIVEEAKKIGASDTIWRLRCLVQSKDPYLEQNHTIELLKMIDDL